MAYTYEGTPVLSKIKIGNSEYYLKDADARAILDTFNNTIVTGTLGTVADNNGNLVTAQNIKSYVDSAVGVGLVVEVVQTLPTASASTTGKLYLVADQGGDTGDNYNEFITVRSGAGTEPDPYTYAWEKIGDTSIDLSGYLTEISYVANSHTLQQTKGGQTTTVHAFGNMADADTASTTVSDYVTGVTSAKTTAAGSIVKDEAADPTGTQIEGTISSLTVIDNVGTVPSLTTATKALYKQGVKCEVGKGADAETLIFSNVDKEADIKVVDTWSAGSASTTKSVTPTFTGAYYNFSGSEVDTTVTLTKGSKTIQVSPDAQA